MGDETKNKIAELESKLTPRGAFEASRWHCRTPAGKLFVETLAEIRALEGSPLTIERAAYEDPLKAAA